MTFVHILGRFDAKIVASFHACHVKCDIIKESFKLKNICQFK